MYSENESFEVPAARKSGESPVIKRWHQRWWGRVIIVFLLVFFSLLTAVIFYIGKLVILLKSHSLTPQQLYGISQPLEAEEQMPTLATTDDPSLGPPDAKVVIVEFADFQCPACKQVQPVVKQMLKDYGDKVLFVFRDFPLINDHPQAAITALAAECANEQGKFWEYGDLLFADQDSTDEKSLKTFAVKLGLNSLQFGNCLQSTKYAKEIEEDLNDGYNAGVRATPTFVINGHLLPGAIPLATFEKIIISELSQK